MKTLSHFALIVLAAAVPLSVAAPGSLNPFSVLSWFTVSSILILMTTDYRALQPATVRVAPNSGGNKPMQAEHPLAA